MKNLIVIRTLGDPRPALYKWASQIKTDTALVVASGDDADVDVLGGKLSKMAVRQQANELSQIYGTPIFFLDKPARGVLYSGLRSRLTGEAAFEELEPLRSMRRRSYGVASNEAFIVATLLRAEVVQFVDDDTGPIQGINVVDRHRDIMTARAAVAVTGGYIGAPWLDTSYFPPLRTSVCSLLLLCGTSRPAASFRTQYCQPFPLLTSRATIFWAVIR